jgi:hypothetical protein
VSLSRLSRRHLTAGKLAAPGSPIDIQSGLPRTREIRNALCAAGISPTTFDTKVSRSYSRKLVTEGSGGGLSLRSDDLDSVGEFYTENEFGQLVAAVEATPAPFGGLGELEDHGEGGFVREASLGTHRAVADGRERAFDDVGRPQMLPMLGREVVEGEQRLPLDRT